MSPSYQQYLLKDSKVESPGMKKQRTLSSFIQKQPRKREDLQKRIAAFYQSVRDAESYYATMAHEVTHWTRHPKRLDRSFGRKSWGDEGYAQEELVAELGAAFLCADLEITPEVRDDHVAYIESWLKVLKNDKRAIFSAAAHAQRAADFLNGFQVTAASEKEAV